MARAILSLLISGLCLSHAAGAGDGPRTYSCQPAYRTFCRNIHVGCAGVTKIPTARLTILVEGTFARVSAEGVETPGSVEVPQNGDLIIRMKDSRNWVRIQPNGRYSHRIYVRGGAAMSHGFCEATPVSP